MSDAVDFYAVYPDFRHREPPELKPKHVRQLDREFWFPAACDKNMSILEIGSGAGLFLAYLHHKGVKDFIGVDLDHSVLEVLPEELKGHLQIIDIWEFLSEAKGKKFDRVALFDVLEHFTPSDGVRLLRSLRHLMPDDGRIVVRLPNAASPWGLQYQHHDLTHRSAYTEGSLRQLALASGFDLVQAMGQRRKRGLRRLTEDAFHWMLSHIITEPPGIWSANFLAVLKPRQDKD